MAKTLKCNECDALFSKPSRLLVHTRKHTGERPFVCDESGCDKSYTNATNLRRHKNVSHCSEKKIEGIMCDFEGCGIVLANKYSLKKHSKKHSPDNYPFTCSECAQGFHRKKQLLKHSYLHTGEPPFKCDKCPMGYTSNSDLNRHKRSHKLHKCDCGEECHTWSAFTAHRKKCKKPVYKCDCGKTFSQVGNFNAHKLTHVDTEQRNVYLCTFEKCDRFYFHKKNLQQHINTFHKLLSIVKNFNCTYPKCEKKFSSTQKMKAHLGTHFKWQKNVARKTRSDKGTIKDKKMIISTLTDNIDTLLNTTENNASVEKDISDDLLETECNLAIQKLQENL